MTFEEKIRRAVGEAREYALANLAWYIVMAGVVLLALYLIYSKTRPTTEDHPPLPTVGQQGWEVYHSLVSLLVFGSVAGMVGFAWRSGFPTRLYGQSDKYGWGWYVATLVIAILVHDAYVNFWDRIFKINHAEYEERFESVTAAS